MESFSILLVLLFTIFPAILTFFLFRHWIWCNCGVCTAYRTSSWARDFPNLGDWYAHLLRTSPTQTIHIHILGNTVTANPAVVEHILRARFDNYPKGKKFSRILGDLLGMGIFNVDGSTWAFQRKHASSKLGSLSIRSFAFETVRGEIEHRLLPLLSSFAGKQGLNKSEVLLDLQEVFKRFSFDNVCNFSFGFDPGCLDPSLPESRFADVFDLATKLSAERALAVSPVVWKIKRFLNIGSERQLREAVTVVKTLARDVIEHKRKSGFSDHGDLLSRFMGCVADDVYLTDIVISFILAGRDTMASAMTAFFWLIRDRQDIVSRIRNEADSIIRRGQDGSGFPSFDQLKEMHYLQATVHESLRLYPPVQFDSKFALDDDLLPDGTAVKSGTRVTYHPYAMGRMERIWGPDCTEFRPERWLDGTGMFVHQNPYKYPVFQAGVRVCLGKEMAVVEMKAVALSVLREFDVEVVEPSSELRFDPGLTAFVRGGLKVLIKRRVDAPPSKGDT